MITLIPIYLQKKILLILCNGYNYSVKLKNDQNDYNPNTQYNYCKDVNNLAMVNKTWFEICADNINVIVDFCISSNYNNRLQRLVELYIPSSNNNKQSSYSSSFSPSSSSSSSLSTRPPSSPFINSNNNSNNNFKFHKKEIIKYFKININKFESYNYYYINILLKYFLSLEMYSNIKAVIVVNNHSLENYKFIDSISFNNIYINSIKILKDDVIFLPAKIRTIYNLDIGPITSTITLLKIVGKINKIRNMVINNDDSDTLLYFRLIYNIFSQIKEKEKQQQKNDNIINDNQQIKQQQQQQQQQKQKSNPLITPFYHLQSLKINSIELDNLYYLLELSPNLKELEIKSFKNVSSLKSNKISYDMVKSHFFNNKNLHNNNDKDQFINNNNKNINNNKNFKDQHKNSNNNNNNFNNNNNDDIDILNLKK